MAGQTYRRSSHSHVRANIPSIIQTYFCPFPPWAQEGRTHTLTPEQAWRSLDHTQSSAEIVSLPHSLYFFSIFSLPTFNMIVTVLNGHSSSITPLFLSTFHLLWAQSDRRRLEVHAFAFLYPRFSSMFCWLFVWKWWCELERGWSISMMFASVRPPSQPGQDAGIFKALFFNASAVPKAAELNEINPSLSPACGIMTQLGR